VTAGVVVQVPNNSTLHRVALHTNYELLWHVMIFYSNILHTYCTLHELSIVGNQCSIKYSSCS